MDDMKYMLAFFIFAAAFFSIYSGIKLFSKAWTNYRETYLKGTTRGLDAMFITIPPQLLLYFSVLTFGFISLFIAALTGRIFVGLIFGVVGFMSPKVMLSVVKKRRDARFQEQLPDALTGIGNSLKAGFSLFQAIDLIQREMGNPISQEFRVLSQELKFGVTLEDSLQNLYTRMPSEDMDLVVSAISIARNVGGNLSEILDMIAYTIRERQKMEGRIKALTSQGRMQGIIMCVLPFLVGVGVYFVSPAIFDVIFSTVYGWGLVLIVIVLELLGAAIIRRIVNIDV